jgi:hypothetical protein
MDRQKSEMRISDLELSALKNTFAENDTLLKTLRKIFLPEVTADAPIGQNIDLWMTLDINGMSPEEAMLNLKARNSLIGHIENCLLQIKILAGQKEETVEQTKERIKKNSSK